MKSIMIISAIITGLLLFSVAASGLRIRYASKPVEESSTKFHMALGLVAAVVSLITVILGVAAAARS